MGLDSQVLYPCLHVYHQPVYLYIRYFDHFDYILTLLYDYSRSTSWLYGKGVGELLVGYDFGLAKCPDLDTGWGVIGDFNTIIFFVT